VAGTPESLSASPPRRRRGRDGGGGVVGYAPSRARSKEKGGAAVAQERGSAVRTLAERFWDQLLEVYPIIGTFIGDERYDDRLPDPSEEGLVRRKTLFEGALAGLGEIDAEDLDPEMRTTYAVLQTGASRELADIEHRIDRFFAVTHLFGPGTLTSTIGSNQRADTPERLDKYISRLRAFPGFLQETSDVAMEAVLVGQVAPGLVVDRAIAQVERLLSFGPEKSPAMKPVQSASNRDKEQVVTALREAVWPAYQAYLETLREYRPSARETIGLSALPGGDEIYASQILGFTSLPLEAQAVHDTGHQQLAMIQEERQTIAKQLGFEDVRSALADYQASGKNTAGSRQEMIDRVIDQVQRSWEAAANFFGRLPRANCEVRPIDEFQEDDMPGAYYNPPTEDGSRPGTYYVNTGHLEERPLHQTATTSFHEANPGHHFQLSIEQEFTDRLPLRRFGGFLVGDAYVEGWGLYSERLGDEMNLFLNEYERLGMLEAQGFRAGRLIVDTGIHALGWDRERAVQQMIETGCSRLDAEIEVDRYIALPGQALAYMIGKLEIDRLRAAAIEREGSSFSLRDFHDRVLALGSLPLPALESELAR
jgi:uncharacterized protein (DUF885 family)